MADTKTSALTSATALTGAEQLPGVQSAASVKITATQMADFARSGMFPGYQASGWNGPPRALPPVANIPTADVIYAIAIQVHAACTITDLGIWVTTGVAATNVKLALYADSGGRPGALLSSVATPPATTSSAAAASGALSASQAVSSGVYWLAAVFNGAPQILLYDNADPQPALMGGGATIDRVLGNGALTVAYTGSGTYSGGFSNPFGTATARAATTVLIAFKTS